MVVYRECRIIFLSEYNLLFSSRENKTVISLRMLFFKACFSQLMAIFFTCNIRFIEAGLESSAREERLDALCRLASCYCNKMIEDQTTQQGAGHAWGKELLRRKKYKPSIMYQSRGVQLMITTVAGLFTHKIQSPHTVLNLENKALQ